MSQNSNHETAQQEGATYDENQAEATVRETEAEAMEATEPGSGEEAGSTGHEELAALRGQVEELQQKYLRAQADFDNFRRRTRQEKEEFAKYASLKLLEQLLPVVDNFERALSSSKDSKDFESLSKGIEMVYRQISQVMEQEGLKPIESVGQPFNPEFHQAIMQVESEEHEEGTVVEEVQKGYMLKDKVIRPSMVKVSS